MKDPETSRESPLLLSSSAHPLTEIPAPRGKPPAPLSLGVFGTARQIETAILNIK